MIKMIAGVYGLSIKNADGSTRVVGMSPQSGAFSIDPKREAELVSKGVAVFVPDAAENKDAIGTSTSFVGSTDNGIPEYSVDMKATELRKIGAEHGLAFKVGMSKVEMVDALDAHFVPDAADDAEEYEDAPSFDAEAAVQ